MLQAAMDRAEQNNVRVQLDLARMLGKQWARQKEKERLQKALNPLDAPAPVKRDHAVVIPRPVATQHVRRAKGHGGRLAGEQGQALEKAVRELPERFTVKEVIAASGLPGKCVSSMLSRRRRLGWCRRVRYGQWERTPAWPQAGLLEQIHADIEAKKLKANA